MKAAIILAVDVYQNPSLSLPAIANDFLLMSELITFSAKFDKVIALNGSQSSSELKNTLALEVKALSNQKIDELLFYYSGHGEISGNEFYYILSDYDPDRKRQTCLQNTELDGLLKSVSPQLCVKIVDACHSGVSYVKELDAFQGYAQKSAGAFKDCYFMFSSLSTQVSYADATRYSHFTQALAQSILDHRDTSIRYKAMIDYVSDAFERKQLQTPYFVVQSDYTDTFCEISAPLREKLAGHLKAPEQRQETEGPGFETSLSSRVKDDAKGFATLEEISKCLEDIGNLLLNVVPPKVVGELFEIKTEIWREQSKALNVREVGEWLKASSNGEYFAEATEATVTEPVLRDPMKFLTLQFRTPSPSDYEMREVKRISGFKSTTPLPYATLELSCTPKFPNIDGASTFLVPVVSRTNIQWFVAQARLQLRGWEKYQLDPSLKWGFRSAPIKDTLRQRELFEGVLRGFWTFLMGPIEEKFGQSNDESGSLKSGTTD